MDHKDGGAKTAYVECIQILYISLFLLCTHTSCLCDLGEIKIFCFVQVHFSSFET